MTDWHPKARDLKRYPHFDKFISAEKIGAIVKDPERVRTNAFFPFIRYIKKYQPFRDKPSRPDPKKRPIRYASRRDACIFAYYRHLLSQLYETELLKLGISACPIAYRKIPINDGSGRGKCNIHFAKDAFDKVVELGDCCVVCLDISKYFESIDHKLLYNIWCRFLDVSELPKDHEAVFKAITERDYPLQPSTYDSGRLVVIESAYR